MAVSLGTRFCSWIVAETDAEHNHEESSSCNDSHRKKITCNEETNHEVKNEEGD